MPSPDSFSSEPACSEPCGGARAVTRCDILGKGQFSEEPNSLFRPYLSTAYRETVRQVAAWMEQGGLSARQDSAGNIVGRYEGTSAEAPALLIGSHLDSVRNAGKYDGPLGVMLGIEVVEHFARKGIGFPFALEVIGFGDEEGSRFPVSMLTSRAVAGLLQEAPANMEDSDGITLQNALGAEGFVLEQFPKAARKQGEVIAYFEPHIEQGPVLEFENKPVGVVSAIAAQFRFLVTLKGVAGHAGTMPMTLRQDALAAAAEAILEIEKIGKADSDHLVATVGRMQVSPGVPNVVPGDVAFTVDIRSGTESIRNEAATQIQHALQGLCDRRSVSFSMVLQQDLPATPCDSELTHVLSRSVQTVTGKQARVLVSGAGHDAMVMAALAPVCMLFIRCEKGISHNPAEAVEASDVETAFQVMVNFIESYADNFSAQQEKIA